MLNDYELFVQMCEKRGILAPLDVSEAIKLGSSTGELKLSCLSLIIPVCEVLSQMLASSSSIKHVDLSDCMLLPKGLNNILNALCDGSSVTNLNLKGNSISGPIAQQLGQVFLCNNTLKCLHLEWNSLGSNVESFSLLCDGLSKNHNIEEIDLKYNQISPNCADSLLKVLKYNKSLKSLDLAWNTLGLDGGHQILNGMHENKTITTLNLRGNCLPDDLMESIEQCAFENKRRQAISKTSIELVKKNYSKENVSPIFSNDNEKVTKTKTKYSKKKIRRRDRDKILLPVSEDNENPLISPSDSDSDSRLKAAIKTAETNSKSSIHVLMGDKNAKDPQVNCKIKELNQILHERTSAIDLLTNEIKSKQTELVDAKSQISKLEGEITRLKVEKEDLILHKVKEISDLQQNQIEEKEMWERGKKDLEDSFTNILSLKKDVDLKVRKYEKDIHKSSVEILALREKLLSSTRAYEDLISTGKTEIHRLRRELKERESRHRIELNILKQSLKESTESLEQCQNQLQKTRTELRDSFESQSNLRAKLKELDHFAQKCVRIEDSLLKVKEEKEAFEDKYSDSQRTIATLQRQVACLEAELVEPQRRYNLLHEEFDQEKKKAERFKDELIEERSRLREQNIQIQKMSLQITSLNTQINEIQTNHVEELREKDKERKQLKEIIAHKERDLNDLKAEEVQRAGHLYAAFSKYMSSMGPSAPT
ncbi:leucine-rich repeat-containing protein 45-like [Leptopilina heterotoma]|uniref:leucine-rich repeat-containing protein 45-like n=1 Tax=Leptopilina heterotoma TaxID=63436 RepID=UPI001CA934A9|nr:leucine-rich repeat-containing protein 45-like [Leptopilina heterotoma]